MSKIIVCPQSKKDINLFLFKKIDAILLSLEDFSVNSNFYVTIDYLNKIIPKMKKSGKEVFVSLNKIMHNRDLPLLEKVLLNLQSLKVDKVLFYDLAVLNIAKKINFLDNLAIYQNHLNNSTLSNEFYYSEGIKTSVLSNELTKEEIISISHLKNMSFILNVYGYLPIFTSKRYLLTSYFKHINKKKKDKYYYLLDEQTKTNHIITEEKEGTTIYYGEIINLDQEFQEFIGNNIEYVLLQSNFIERKIYFKEVEKYLNMQDQKQVTITNSYKGFMYQKPYFKVDNHE